VDSGHLAGKLSKNRVFRLTLAAIYRYPVKSLRGEAFAALDVEPRGLAGDRRWMLVDHEGCFLTQRQLPRMALVQAHIAADGGLSLQAPGMPEIEVAPAAAGDRLEVLVWQDRLPVVPAPAEADRWLSTFMDAPCRLVYLPDEVRRPVDPEYGQPRDQVGFADGFPFLLISQGSLDDLNGRLERALPMLRFRPNLVVAGCPPYAEDGWRRIRIGDLGFRVVKPCSRCVIPTIDLETAERGPEPLRTLLGYRRRGNKVYFGQNLIHDGQGRLEVGMPVEVVE
jgi:uncharacterized protein YcbX